MPSNALRTYLEPLLDDAKVLDDAYMRLAPANPAGRQDLEALSRAAVVTCVSAWEAFVEELVRESVEAMRPAQPPLGVWSAHSAWIAGQLARFNNPAAENVRTLLSDALGLPSVQTSWVWPGTTAAQAFQQLAEAIRFRHQTAHGTHPRPAVPQTYSSRLPGFFRSLGRATDQAVRDHLVNVIGLVSPWPP